MSILKLFLTAQRKIPRFSTGIRFIKVLHSKPPGHQFAELILINLSIYIAEAIVKFNMKKYDDKIKKKCQCYKVVDHFLISKGPNTITSFTDLTFLNGNTILP